MVHPEMSGLVSSIQASKIYYLVGVGLYSTSGRPHEIGLRDLGFVEVQYPEAELKSLSA